jgi:hypothetical protein
MRIYDFKAMSIHKQYKVLSELGIYLVDRIAGGYKFILYQIDTFYVEVKYNSLADEVMTIKTFLNTKLLDPYLNQIQLPKFE